MDFERDVVDVDMLENLETAIDKDSIEKEDAEVVKLDYCQAMPRIGEMRSAGALVYNDRGQGRGVRGSG